MADDLDPSANPFGRPDEGSPLYTPPVQPPVPAHTKRAIEGAHLAPLPATPAKPTPLPTPATPDPGGSAGAMFKPSAAPDEGITGRSAGVVSGLARSFGHVAMEGVRGQGAAGRQLVEDVTGPQTDPLASQPGGRFTQDIMGVAGGGFLGGIAKAAVGEPVANVVNPAVRKATGGQLEVDPQRLGDLATLAIPFLGEANEARAASAFAKQAGISEDAAREAMALARKNAPALAKARHAEEQTDKARRAAALRLVPAPGSARVLHPEHGVGRLDSAATLKAGQEFRDVGAGEPTLLDVAKRPTQRVIRTAGAKMGEADTTLEAYRQRTRLKVGEEARRRALEEAPKPDQSVEQRVESLGKERDDLASGQFRAPYAAPLKTDDALFDVLFKGFPEGPAMVRRAMDDASRRMLTDPEAENQFNQLKSLHKYVRDKARFEEEQLAYRGELMKIRRANPNATPEELEFLTADIKKPEEPEPPTISAGALDRVFRHVRDKAVDVSKTSRTTGGGIRARADLIGQYLDNVPGLQEARSVYRDYSKRVEVLQLKANVAKMLPREFNRYIADLLPEQLDELKNKFIEDYAEAFGTSSRKVQSSEDVMTTGPNTKDNLRALFGEDKADKFMRAIELLGKSVDSANYAASGVGSQTAMIRGDLQETAARGIFAVVSGRTHMMLYEALKFLDRWLLHVPDESNEILAEWATGRPDEHGDPTMSLEETLQDIVDAVKADEEGKLKSLKLLDTTPKGGKFPPEIAAILAGAALRDKPKEDNEGQPGQEAAPGQPPVPADMGPLDPAQNPFGKGAADGEASPSPTETSTAPEGPVAPEIENLLHQVAVLEGSGDNAVSPAGAIGKYQIMPKTAIQYGFDPERLFDPEYNRQAATSILTDLNQRFGGDLGPILVAYNAGPGRANEWLAAGKDPRVLPAETRKYLYNAGLLGGDALGGGDPGGGIAGPSLGMSPPLIPDFGLSDGQ